MFLNVNNRPVNVVQEFATAAGAGALAAQAIAGTAVLPAVALATAAKVVEKGVVLLSQKVAGQSLKKNPHPLLLISAKVISFVAVVGVSSLILTASLVHIAALVAIGIVGGTLLDIGLTELRKALFTDKNKDINVGVAPKHRTQPLVTECTPGQAALIRPALERCSQLLKSFDGLNFDGLVGKLEDVVHFLEDQVKVGVLTAPMATAVLMRSLMELDHTKWKEPVKFHKQNDPKTGFCSNYTPTINLPLPTSENFSRWLNLFEQSHRKFLAKPDQFFPRIPGVKFKKGATFYSLIRNGVLELNVYSTEHRMHIQKLLTIAEHPLIDDATRAKCYWQAVLVTFAATPADAKKIAGREGCEYMGLNLSHYFDWFDSVKFALQYEGYRLKFPKGDERLLGLESYLLVENTLEAGYVDSEYGNDNPNNRMDRKRKKKVFGQEKTPPEAGGKNMLGKSLILRVIELLAEENISFLTSENPFQLPETLFPLPERLRKN